MDRAVSVCALIVCLAAWVILSTAAPWVLSDQNEFLKGFVNQEFLGFMGVIVTITLASAANLHIELNKLEECIEKYVFTETKRHVRHSAIFLLTMLPLALIVVVSKPLLPNSEVSRSFVNGAALIIVLASIMILADLTLASFRLQPFPSRPDLDGRS